MLPRIVLTHAVHAHLSTLARLLQGSGDDDVLEFLEQELARADLVEAEALDPGVATTGSRVLYRERIRNVTRVGILVLPGDKDRVPDAVSVLEPEGACLLGLSEGQSLAYWAGNRMVCDVTLEAIVRP